MARLTLAVPGTTLGATAMSSDNNKNFGSLVVDFDWVGFLVACPLGGGWYDPRRGHQCNIYSALNFKLTRLEYSRRYLGINLRSLLQAKRVISC